MSSFSSTSRSGVAFRLAGAAQSLRQRVSAHRAARRERERIVAELSCANDRELMELGYSRADLIAIARGTYQR